MKKTQVQKALAADAVRTKNGRLWAVQGSVLEGLVHLQSMEETDLVMMAEEHELEGATFYKLTPVDDDALYLIKGPIEEGEQLYWSNRDGWVSKLNADEFKKEDVQMAAYLEGHTGLEEV